jgi:hypothetical protein
LVALSLLIVLHEPRPLRSNSAISGEVVPEAAEPIETGDVEEAEPAGPAPETRSARGRADLLNFTGEAIDSETATGVAGLALWFTGSDWTGHALARTNVQSGENGKFTGSLERRSVKVLSWVLHDLRYALVDPTSLEVSEGSMDVAVRLLVRRWTTLAVRVRRASGAPAAHARLEWAYVGKPGPRLGAAETGADGVAEIPLEDGVLRVTAVAPGSERGFLAPMEPCRAPLEMILQDAAPIPGRVVGEDGAGIAGLRIRLTVQDGEEMRNAPWLAGRLVDDTVTTGGAGDFVLRSASPRFVYRARVSAEAGAGWTLRPDRLALHGNPVFLVATRR